MAVYRLEWVHSIVTYSYAMETTPTIIVRYVVEVLKLKMEFPYMCVTMAPDPHIKAINYLMIVRKSSPVLTTTKCTQQTTIEFKVAYVPAMNVIPVVKLFRVKVN